MKLNVAVTVAPDDPRVPVVYQDATVELSPQTVKDFIGGAYPMRLQIFIEAAVPKLVKEAIREGGSR